MVSTQELRNHTHNTQHTTPPASIPRSDLISGNVRASDSIRRREATIACYSRLPNVVVDTAAERDEPQQLQKVWRENLVRHEDVHRIDAVSLYGSSLCQGTDDGDENSSCETRKSF